MSKRDIRQKASDVFNEKTFLFGETGSFAEAFPQIEDIRIEVKEEGEGISHWLRERQGKNIYTLNSSLPGEYVNCSNPRCYNGGFHLGQLIRYMIENDHQTELQDTRFCQGYEGSPKGRKKYDECSNTFDVKITIKYKPAGEK